jgi:hypothetical protein
VTQTDPKLLNKYMGEDVCAAYLKHHGKSVAVAAKSA